MWVGGRGGFRAAVHVAGRGRPRLALNRTRRWEITTAWLRTRSRTPARRMAWQASPAVACAAIPPALHPELPVSFALLPVFLCVVAIAVGTAMRLRAKRRYQRLKITGGRKSLVRNLFDRG